jgi:hypothetical protein
VKIKEIGAAFVTGNSEPAAVRAERQRAYASAAERVVGKRPHRAGQQRERRAQRLVACERFVPPRGLEREQRGERQPVREQRADRARLGRELPRERDPALLDSGGSLRLRLVPLLDRDAGSDRRHDGKHTECRRRRPGHPPGAPVLGDVFANERVLAPSVQRRSQLGDCVPEARMLEREIGLAARPPEIEPERLLVECPHEWFGKRGRARGVESARGRIPGDGAVGDDDQRPLDRVRLEPVRHLTLDPRRCGGLRRCQQDEERRPVDGDPDRFPQARCRMERRLVAEDVHGSQPIPGLGEAMQSRMHRGGQPAICRMAVRHERVIRHGGIPAVPAGAATGLTV